MPADIPIKKKHEDPKNTKKARRFAFVTFCFFVLENKRRRGLGRD